MAHEAIDGNIYTYTSVEDALLEASRITNIETGITQNLSNSLKILYVRMRKRFLFFKENGKSYYDNVEDLANSIDVSKRTVEGLLNDLESLNLITRELSGRSNFYTVAKITPETFLLERKQKVDKKEIWINTLESPVFASKFKKPQASNSIPVPPVNTSSVDKAPVIQPETSSFEEDESQVKRSETSFVDEEELEEHTERLSTIEDPINVIAKTIYNNLHNRKANEPFSDYVARNLEILFPDKDIHRLHSALTKHISKNNLQFIDEFEVPF